ncbi:peptide ABC transporter substrate-binding protein [Jiangella alkaliphila]|uniref:Oligopeptide transport system substrate-binding protein n=1 Tax=Jiangella alkaliphila TaxID=419479 RepID=A0A1H2JCT7_9ACTN|nr:ABC transporter substrate-binding protein [Jiangella alkaliphila]SDU54026.1 oligopeptide transport system substrate-binding protein [Jiangella alkaliphila]
MPVSPRRSVVLGAIAVTLALGACGGGDDTGDAAGESANTVTVRGCNPQAAFVPANSNEVCSGDILDQIFSYLVTYDPETGQPTNEIAADITTEDSVNWTITLEDGWTFHDGSPVTAQSFVDAWNWAALGDNATLNSYFFEPIAGYADVQNDVDDEGNPIEGSAAAETMSGLQVVDELTFTVALSAAESQFPMRLGYTAFAPLPESFYDDPEAYGQHPIGTGPFQFDSWDPNIDVRISAYEDYNGDVKPSIDGAVYRIYENDDAAYNALQADQLDIMPLLPTSALAGETYKIDLGDRFLSRETGVFETITFAPSSVDARFDDPRLRQAISMSINRPEIVEQIFAGARTPATGWVSPVVADNVDGACGDFCTYDPTAAAALYAETDGFPDGETLALSYNGDSDHKAWVDAVCQDIDDALGIPCIGTPVVDLATFRDQITNREMSGIFRTGWQMDYPSLENFLVPIFATGASANDGDYSDDEFDSLVGQAAAAPDAATGVELYHQAERLLAEDMPAIPLWHRVNIAGYSTHVENVRITIFQTVDLLSVTTTG